MPKRERDDIREERISMEIIVDAYDEEEQAMGWYYYLSDNIQFPFRGKWTNRQRPGGKEVTVLEMSPADDCLHDIFVEVLYKVGEAEDVFSARLSEIEPIDVDEETEEAIEDWHYWIERYQL